MLEVGNMWLREPPRGGQPSTCTLPPPLPAFGEQPERDLISLATSHQRHTMYLVGLVGLGACSTCESYRASHKAYA